MLKTSQSAQKWNVQVVAWQMTSALHSELNQILENVSLLTLRMPMSFMEMMSLT